MIVFSADLHLCRLVWKARNDLAGDSFRALSAFGHAVRQLKQAHPNEKIHLLLGGDIFHANRIQGASLEAFTQFVDNLFEEGIEAHFIQGNHDHDPDLPIATVQGATHIHKTSVMMDDMVVYGLDSMSREEVAVELQEIPPNVDVLVLHGMMEHLIDFEAAADFRIEDIPNHVKHVLVGDIHINNVEHFNPDTTVVSPGPLHPTSIDQKGPYGFYYLLKGSKEWSRVNIPGRVIHRTEMFDELAIPALDQLLATLSRSVVPDQEPIVEIKYTCELSDHIERWVSKYPMIRIFGKPSSVGKMMTKEELVAAQESFQDLTLINSLPLVVDPDQEEEVFNLCHALLTAPSPKLIIEKKVLPYATT